MGPLKGSKRENCEHWDRVNHMCRLLEKGIIPKGPDCLECIVAIYREARE